MGMKLIMADYADYDNKNLKLGNHHYTKLFSQDDFEVLCINDVWNHLQLLKNKQNYLQRKKSGKIRLIENNIYNYSPFSFAVYGNYPLCKSPKIIFNNQKYIYPNINKTLKSHNFNEVDILWISNLRAFWLTNVIKYKKLVYRMPDDIQNSKYYPKSIIDVENNLIDKSDTIFVTSRLLVDKVQKRGKDAIYLPNGVDFNHFNQEYKVPSEYKENNKRIVYVGNIGEHFDKNLIKYVSQNIQADIYLIGKINIDLNDLKKYKNIYILGEKSYQTIPAYLKYADVAIIPFIKNKFTDAINPIKLFEYCSTGIGVVTSNMEEVKNLKPPIYIAKNYQDFVEGINFYLNNHYDKKDIINFGKDNSWNKRYAFIKTILEL